VALALFATFIAVELSLYITFDNAGQHLIIGVQSRYFLPFLPFFIFLLPWFGRLRGAATLTAIPQGWFALPAVALALVNAWALPVFIFHLYRMAGP
jgi:hypothetical protein